MRIEVHLDHPQPRRVGQGVELLRNGGVICMPTEATYVLACDPGRKKAVDMIRQWLALGDRETLTMLCADLKSVARLAVVDDDAFFRLKEGFPGSQTYMLAPKKDVPRWVSVKKKQMGFRVSGCSVAQIVSETFGAPLCVAEACLNDRVLMDPEEIARTMKGLACVLDAGWLESPRSEIIEMS